jgi:hypothetical protein
MRGMDVKVGPHWYRNSNGTIEIEGLPQIDLSFRKGRGPLNLTFAIFDHVGQLHAKIEASSLIINHEGTYELIKKEDGLLLQRAETKKPVLDLKVSEGDKVEISQGEFYTLKGHLFTITPLEWSVEKTQEREGETDSKGNAVCLAG